MTIKELHTQWGEDPQYRRLCATTRAAFTAVILQHYGDTDITTVTHATLSAWLEGSAAPAQMIVSASSALRNAMEWAQRHGLWQGHASRIHISDGVFDRQAFSAVNVADTQIQTLRGGRRFPETNTRKPATQFSRAKRSKDERRTDLPVFSAHHGATLSEMIDGARRGTMREGRPLPEGAVPYTSSQQAIRCAARKQHYQPGDSTDGRERLVFHVGPTTHRSANLEQKMLRHGFTLLSLSGVPLSFLPPRTAFDDAISALRMRAEKRGYVLGDRTDDAERMKVYITPVTRRNGHTDNGLVRRGFLIIDN